MSILFGPDVLVAPHPLCRDEKEKRVFTGRKQLEELLDRGNHGRRTDVRS